MAFTNYMDSYDKMLDWFSTKPPFVFVENEETQIQRTRFVQCLKDTGGLKGLNIDLKALEKLYYAQELRELFDSNKDEELDNIEIIDGLNNIAINYMLRNTEIEKRVNAYITIKLFFAEIEIEGGNTYISQDRVEDAQMLFVCDDGEDKGNRHDCNSIEKPSRANLFRSDSLTASELDKTKEVVDINLSSFNNEAIFNCFPKLFGDSDICKRDYKDKRQCVIDFWELLDVHKKDELSRQDLLDRFRVLALNWMANDDLSQSIANSYLQRKIQHAIFVVSNVDPTNQDRELPIFLPKTFVTYKDTFGGLHKVCVHEYNYETELFRIVFETGVEEHVSKDCLLKLENSNIDEDDYSQLIENKHVREEFALATAIKNKIESQGRMVAPVVEPHNFFIFFGDAKMNFHKKDYLLHFTNFLTNEYVDDLKVVEECPSAHETCRCFFLHLGVAVETHPFLLQLQFREGCRSLLQEPADENNIRRMLFSEAAKTVLKQSVYIDFSIVLTVWPEQLKNYRILLVTFATVGSSDHAAFQCCSMYTPNNGPWKADKTNEFLYEDIDHPNGKQKIFAGKDIILKLQDGHFTILEPNFTHEDNTIEWIEERPIDNIRQAIYSFNSTCSHKNKVILHEYCLGDYTP